MSIKNINIDVGEFLMGVEYSPKVSQAFPLSQLSEYHYQ